MTPSPNRQPGAPRDAYDQRRQHGADTDTCSYTYDSRSNRTSTVVNGNASTAMFDNRSRLNTITYLGGMIVTYTYDPRGLVTRVEDNYTGASIEIEYNGDSQIVKTTRSNGRVTNLEYDIEGLLTKLSHDSGPELNISLNRADEPTKIQKTGFPADGSAALTSDSTTSFVYNINNEITNGGFTYDERGRPDNCTWGSDSRLVGVNNGSPISYRYDALGQITSRTEIGTLTEYLYNSAIRNNPIIGEKSGASFSRFYVALPNGQIVYHIDDPEGTPSVSIHHHGQTGNVRYLTDSSGTITDSYAYDAYGRLLEKNGASEQFYTYVGRLGVRTDEVAGLLHMR